MICPDCEQVMHMHSSGMCECISCGYKYDQSNVDNTDVVSTEGGRVNLLPNEQSINNGGKTDYYQIDSAPFKINDFDDFAEWRKLNGNQFNIGKVVWTMNVGRHSGTTYVRDLNKIIHYAKRELQRLEREALGPIV